MELEFIFEYPHTSWATSHVFGDYYNFFIKKNKKIKTSFVNASKHFNGNPSGLYSPHHMIIKNKFNGKYFVISYWDRPHEITWEGNGWDVSNCVEIFTSSGFYKNPKFVPFSYLCYFNSYDELSKLSKKIIDKENNELFFRGLLYGERHLLSEVGKINIKNDKIFPELNYFNEITNNKVCLSLNGAGQICNRDMEILGARSVLLRKELTCEFHNELVPNYHYITYENNSDSNLQSEIILDKFKEISKNKRLMNKISENGYKWFKKNATVISNVNILNKIIILDKLS